MIDASALRFRAALFLCVGVGLTVSLEDLCDIKVWICVTVIGFSVCCP